MKKILSNCHCVVIHVIYSWLVLSVLSCNFKEDEHPKQVNFTNWSEYLGSSSRNHYSHLTQIDTTNVHQLEIAWTYKTGDFGEMQCNPIVVSGVLYGTTATCEAFALNAQTGKEKWRHRPETEKSFLKSRGVSYWQRGNDKRILYTYGEWLYALDVDTGLPIASFGLNGRVSLKSGLKEDSKNKYVMSRTPGAIFKNLIIMPLVVGESYGAASGYIQAFNVETGAVEWVFKTIPDKGEAGSETWPKDLDKAKYVGGANSWAGMAVDLEREIVFAPTGSAAFDFYGGNRKGKNLYANTLLALNARTGEKIWHFQFVHHDIWDRDLPAPPNLVTVNHNGKKVDAVAQITKTGHIFLFERETGVPLFPIEEKSMPPSSIPDEEAWATQPIPTLPKPFSRQTLTEEDINPLSSDYKNVLDVFRKSKKGYFQPLDTIPTILFPGCDGGGEWGGAAVNADGIMYVNSNEMAWLFSLSRRKETEKNKNLSLGERTYKMYCASCHQNDLSGAVESGYPSLINIGSKLNKNRVSKIIENGQGMMPGFTQISEEEMEQLIAFLYLEEKTETIDTIKRDEINNLPDWVFNGYNKFLDSDGNPAITPPWGQLTAVDLNTGNHLWQIPLGQTKLTENKELGNTGTENYGGPLITANHLLFIAATKDNTFRAFNAINGKLLWDANLPASAFATPSTYSINGQQYIVVACGGGKLGTEKGDSFVAYKLP